MKELDFMEFKEQTLALVRQMVKLCQGAFTEEGAKVMTDCLYMNRTYFYTNDASLYSSMDCLIGYKNQKHQIVMISSVYKEGLFSSDSFTMMDPLHKFCTKITPAIYEQFKDEVDVFLSLRFAITYYDHEHGFHSLSIVPKFHALTVFSIEHLHKMLLDDIKDLTSCMKRCRRCTEQSFPLFDDTITFNKEQMIYGLMNSLFSSDRYMKYTTLAVIETCAGACKRTTIFQTYIELILIQLFDYQLSYEQLELAFLPSITKDFLHSLSRQYRDTPDSIDYTYDVQMQYIREGIAKAVKAIWNIDLNEIQQKEQRLKERGLFTILETSNLSLPEEISLIRELLRANPADPLLWNYLCASHPEEIDHLQKILYFFHLAQPTDDLIHHNFCRHLFPESVQMLGLPGIAEYMQSLRMDEAAALQQSLRTASKKYHYPTHELSEIADLVMEDRTKGQNHLY